ncbi:MAG: lytic transglycosylase domain-containing protein, partial [Limnobacter sp.]|nr:lytic transglycosylase domain-containing protein [Limnobacter sp.]
ESSYNPFAASSVGAKGLMQVMANIHKDKFEALSPGDWNPLHPELNMRVGSKIIREYTRRTGSVREGLVWYVGAAIHRNDGGYPDKVLGLKSRIDKAYNKGALLAKNESRQEHLSAVQAKASQG